MSHFTVLTAAEVPQDIGEAMRSIPYCQAMAYNMREYHLAKLCARPGDELPQIPPVTDQSRLEALMENTIGVILERYDGNTSNPDYLEFADMTDCGREQYENDRDECVRMPDGRIVTTMDYRFREKYEYFEGKVYKREFGPLHHRKRTKKAKQIMPLPEYPIKKLYPTFDAFMWSCHGCTLDSTTGRYGHWLNPDGKWDWYQIGGRWPYSFLVKEDCKYPVCGELSHMCDGSYEPEAPEGYRWVAGARKCDIAWDVMREFYREKSTERFYQLERWFREGEMPAGPMHGVVITEEGLKDWRDELMYRKDETLEEYLTRQGLSETVKYPVSPFACLDQENGWRSEGDMGWFGISYNLKEEEAWDKEVQDFISAQADDTFLVVVDCHGF